MNLDYTSLIINKCITKDEAMKRIYPFMWNKMISLKIAMIGETRKSEINHCLELFNLAKEELEKYYNKACHPKDYYDLLLTARACKYKAGWAYYRAKEFNFETPIHTYCFLNKRASQSYDYEDEYDYAFSSYAEYDMI